MCLAYNKTKIESEFCCLGYSQCALERERLFTSIYKRHHRWTILYSTEVRDDDDEEEEEEVKIVCVHMNKCEEIKKLHNLTRYDEVLFYINFKQINLFRELLLNA